MRFLSMLLPYVAAVTTLYCLGGSAWTRRTVSVALVAMLILGLGVGCQPPDAPGPRPGDSFLVFVQLGILGAATGLGVMLDRLDPR